MQIPRKIYTLLIALLFFLTGCFEEDVLFNSTPTDHLELPVLLKFDGRNCALDAKLKIIRFSIPTDTVENYSPLVDFDPKSEVEFEGSALKNGDTNNLGTISTRKKYTLKVVAGNKAESFDVYFTRLPIVQIIATSEIFDEPKQLARIQLSDPHTPDYFSSFAGVEFRGKFSRSFPKKSFGFRLWDKGESTQPFTHSFLNSGANSDWILNGGIIDPSRIRNTVSFRIWKNMEKEFAGETQHWNINLQPVELFFNNEFRGMYSFTENVNTHFLQAKTGAVLYKARDWADGATLFQHFEPKLSQNQYWNGWEQKIPDRKDVIDWRPMKTLYEMVVNQSDETFKTNIASLIDIDNFIDYYILLNLTSAGDNTGKNIFLYQPGSSEKFCIIPWDLDGSWGINYDGSLCGTSSILSNNLFDRLKNTNAGNYREKMQQRWKFLRQSILSEEALKAQFAAGFQQLNATDIIQFENQIWSLNLNLQEEQAYINNWMRKRLEFLDSYFENEF